MRVRTGLNVTALCAMVALAACTKEPARDVKTMSTSEMEAALAENSMPAQSEKIQLRLAGIYAQYGSDSQKAKGLGYMSALAQGGNLDAAEMNCRSAYLSLGGAQALAHCKSAADQGRPRAMAAMCLSYYDASDYGPAREMCERAAEAGQGTSYLPLGVMIANGLGGEAFAYQAINWLELSATEGPVEDRDGAVAQLKRIPEAEKYLYQSDRDLRRSVANETAAIAINEVIPRAPRTLRRDAQCRLVYEITPTGLLFNMDVTCSEQSLVQPVLSAAHQWRFTPRTVHGVPAYTARQSTVIPFKANQ